jgi:hypothetical protein
MKLNILRKNIIVRLTGAFLPSFSVALADLANGVTHHKFVVLFAQITSEFDDLFFNSLLAFATVV